MFIKKGDLVEHSILGTGKIEKVDSDMLYVKFESKNDISRFMINDFSSILKKYFKEENVYKEYNSFTHTWLNEDGYDDDGFSREGYNREGYNRDGYNREGYNREGYNRDGYNRDGYNRKGFNCKGFNKKGIHFKTRNRYNLDGFDVNGYDDAGFDREGYNREGFNCEGFNKKGIHLNTRNRYNLDGFDVNGYDRHGFDKKGVHYIKRHPLRIYEMVINHIEGNINKDSFRYALIKVGRQTTDQIIREELRELYKRLVNTPKYWEESVKKEIVRKKGWDIFSPYERTDRSPSCYTCGGSLNSDIHQKCPKCNWLICPYDNSCGCGFGI